MPHPVVHFEVFGRDHQRLQAFYHEVFGWELFAFPNGYALVETEPHFHDEATGATTYTGDAAFMNEGVVLEEDGGGMPTWRYRAESRRPYFSAGIGGGIGPGGPSVSFSIEVGDLDATLARIETHGGRTTEAPHEAAPGVWVAGFADPEGNVLGLVREPAEQSA
ncbi:MAG: hypothetical protein GEU80_05445 [Dehalococcoidia bacterium]|nr:hypothetical protein [Dehalococcoidia bacterium]